MEYPFETSKDERPVKAIFEIDLLSDYSRLVIEYNELTQRRSLLNNTILNAQLPQFAYDSLQSALVQLDERIGQIEQSFSSERRALSNMVSPQQGEVYIDEFSKLLRTEFISGSEEERRYVERMGTSHSPLVLNCLRIYWSDLVRYSFDAFVAQSLSPYFQHMNLKIELSLELLPEDRLHVSIGNNVGGFQIDPLKSRPETSQKRLAFYFGREFQLEDLKTLLEEGVARTGLQQARRLFDASFLHNRMTLREGSISIVSPQTPVETLTIRDFLQLPLISSMNNRHGLFSGFTPRTKEPMANIHTPSSHG